ncbi:molecular chaperone DnaJ [Salinarchaeum chitinilyticum]
MSEDFYDVLGVSRDADEDEIQQAYRKKAAEYHPDVSDDPDAEEKFKKAKKAKEVLTDEEKRQAYDQLGHERFVEAEKRGGFDEGRGGMGGQGPFGGAAGGGQGPFGGAAGGGQGFGSVEDIFEQFFGGGGGRGGGSRRRQGSDLRTGLEIDLEEAYHGVEKQMTVERPTHCGKCDGEGHPPDSEPETCPECNGRGQVQQVQQTPFGRVQQTGTCGRCGGSGEVYDETCSECRGEGVVREETTLSVDIPAGIEEGQTLRMEREGAPSPTQGPNGDLLIDVQIADHPDFERDGDDLRYHKGVTFPQVVFGDTVSVPTIDGETELEVPAGTQSGEEFRLAGEGMPRLRRRGEGDLYVTIQVVTPESLNEDQREALEAFAEAGGEEIEVDQSFLQKIKSSF